MATENDDSGVGRIIVTLVAIVAIVAVAYVAMQLLRAEPQPKGNSVIDVNITDETPEVPVGTPKY